jgi:hypothetical protein
MEQSKMRTLGYYHSASGICIAVAMLAGCGGSQPPTGTPGAMQQSAAQKGALQSHSRMALQAKHGDLLYVSDNLGNNVYVFSYPTGNVVGKLTGFGNPLGECVDTAGDIWIVNSSPPEMVEYAHGGTSPIATLSDPGEEPSGCSVDPTTGNLAVANHYPGNVAIYQQAKGTPTLYSDPNLTVYFYCTYDNAGDLFVDGNSSTVIPELPKGSSTFNDISLNESINPGSMQWDGKYLAITDMASGTHGPTPIKRVQISESSGMIVGTTLLRSRGDRKAGISVQYWIDGRTIVGPDHSIGGTTRLFEFWSYPAGGRAKKVLKPSGAIELWGTTISRTR